LKRRELERHLTAQDQVKLRDDFAADA